MAADRRRATFAAFPEWYSTLFSGAYIVLFVILLCLIVRVCAIEWRPKVNSQTWRDRWDWVHTVSAWLPSILWGVAFANLVQGMHIEVVQTSNGAVVPATQVPADSLVPGAAHQITGGLLTMVTPFTLLGGAVTCLLFLNHGALFVALKTTGDLSQRALRMSRRLAPAATAVTAAWALWAQLAYSGSALSWIPLVIAAAGLIGSLLMGRTGSEGRAFALHFVGIAFAVVFIFAAMAPNVMRSSVDPAYSLTIQQAASADTTLLIMSVAAAVSSPGSWPTRSGATRSSPRASALRASTPTRAGCTPRWCATPPSPRRTSGTDRKRDASAGGLRALGPTPLSLSR